MRVLVVGLGTMGRSHALAYHAHPDVEIIGLVNRSDVALPQELAGYPRFATFAEGLALKPDLVCVATYSDSHADYAIAAMENGADVFVEKPLAANLREADALVRLAEQRSLVLHTGHQERFVMRWLACSPKSVMPNIKYIAHLYEIR